MSTMCRGFSYPQVISIPKEIERLQLWVSSEFFYSGPLIKFNKFKQWHVAQTVGSSKKRIEILSFIFFTQNNPFYMWNLSQYSPVSITGKVFSGSGFVTPCCDGFVSYIVIKS